MASQALPCMIVPPSGDVLLNQISAEKADE
jgi:hypothetical protein